MPHECTNCGRAFPDGSKEMLSGCPDCGGNKFQFTPSPPESADTAGGTSATGDPDAADGTNAASGTNAADGTNVADETETPPSAAETADRAESAEQTDSSAATDTIDDWVTADSVSRSEARPHRTEEDRQTNRNQLNKTDVSSREWPDTARRPEDRSGSANEDQATESTAESGTARTPPSSTWDESEPGSNQSDDDSTAVSSPSIDETEGNAQADARSEVVSSDDLPTGSVESADNADPAGDGPTEDDERPPDYGRVVSEPSGEQPSMEELRAELNEQFESIKILEPGQYELNLMELYNREEYIVSLQEDGRYVIDVPDSWRDGEE